MSDALTRVPPQSAPPSTTAPDASRAKTAKSDAVLCERCTTEMFRMHAVWRCPNCGYKTDCCGW
jgi:rubrerythrin